MGCIVIIFCVFPLVHHTEVSFLARFITKTFVDAVLQVALQKNNLKIKKCDRRSKKVVKVLGKNRHIGFHKGASVRGVVKTLVALTRARVHSQ